MAFEAFNEVYQQSVSDVMRFYSAEMQKEMARHNVAWAPGRIDFSEYLYRSAVRFFIVHEIATLRNVNSMCDVGGFWGVLPLTLRRPGIHSAAMTEALSYYGDAFRPLFDFLRDSGVEIIDFDPFEETQGIGRRFDLVTSMAVLEHYPHSLKGVVRTMTLLAHDSGHLYFEVPNIAYLPKRLALLSGVSPLSSITDVYESDVPFIGHHHEFTELELDDLCRLSGLRVEDKCFYNYSTDRRLITSHGFRALLESIVRWLGTAPYLVAPRVRECISVVCSAGCTDRHLPLRLPRKAELGHWTVQK